MQPREPAGRWLGTDSGRQTRLIKFLLVHSPLVGPHTFAPLAAVLTARGHDVALPDLRSALTSGRPQWRAIVDHAVAATSTSTSTSAPDVIVAHSGAGVLTPLVASRLRPRHTVFVDAIVPGDGPAYQASSPFMEFVDSLPRDHDGLLPPWHEWWSPDVFAALVPDADLRAAIAADTPRVPRSFYDDFVPQPTGWATRAGNCYLELSPAYDNDRARATNYGWPAAVMNGQHLDLAVKPNDVAEQLLALVNTPSRHEWA